MSENKHLSNIEKIKQASDNLRGSIKESLQDEITGAIREDDQAVIKFHGMYQQDDRDRREERAAKKLDRLYSFMIRLRLPGGFVTPQQWIAVHDIAGENSTGWLFMIIVRRSKAWVAKTRSSSQKAPRRMPALSRAKIRKSASFSLKIYQ